MKGMLKKFMIYAALGLMQAGLFATVASAAPQVEESPAIEECYGDPACMNECANGVTTECKKLHHKNPTLQVIPQIETDDNILDGFFQGDQIQTTCNK